MLKIRLQGTLRDIQWFRRILENHKELDVLEVSDAYANKGTSKYSCLCRSRRKTVNRRKVYV